MAPSTPDDTGLAATRLVDEHHPDGVSPDDYAMCECGWTADDENERWADHLVHVLAVDGLLADPGYMPWGHTVDEGVQGALRHLSALASTAGKRRTAEWLAECAELVTAPGSPTWPPAPAYKGPVVPAAELAEAKAALEQVDEVTGYWQAEQQTAIAMSSAYGKAIRERDRLKAGNEGAADRIAELTEERDQLIEQFHTMRGIAVDCGERIRKVRALHPEFKIYDECGHDHTDEEWDAGQAFEIADVGLTCDEGYIYSVCRRCCTDDTGIQGEACANHERPCWPCKTVAALQSDQPTPSELPTSPSLGVGEVTFVAPADWRDQLDDNPVHVIESWVVSPPEAVVVTVDGEPAGEAEETEVCDDTEPLNGHRCQLPAGHDVHRWHSGDFDLDVWSHRPRVEGHDTEEAGQ